MIKKLREIFREIAKGQEERLRELRAALPLHEAGIDRVHAHPRALTSNHVVLEDPHDAAAVDRFIWHVTQQHLREMGPEETLVILMGEAHAMPMTMAAQAGLLTRLAHWRDAVPDDTSRHFVLAYEQPYDVLQTMARESFRKIIPEEAFSTLHDFDENNHAVLKIAMGNEGLPYARYSREMVFHTAIRHDIPVCLNDACHDLSQRLSPHDKLALKVAWENCSIDLAAKKVGRADYAAGLAIRNIVMVERALEEARKRGVRIIVQQAGLAHLYGMPYENSLAKLFNKSGCRTLGVFFKGGDPSQRIYCNIIPQAMEENSNHIFFENAAYEHFHHFQSRDEMLFLHKLAASYAPEECPYPVENQPITREEAEAHVDSILRKAGIEPVTAPPCKWWQILSR